MKNSKIPIIGTGLSGLVGSKLIEKYQNKYLFDNLDLSNPQRPIDITDKNQVEKVIAESKARFVVHMAAFTNVTAAWEQTNQKDGLCYRINVEGTRNVAEACAHSGKQLIHISTAYVFDGRKETPYTESDRLSPIEWYGETKAMAEEIVQKLNTPWTILRIDQPFRSDTFDKPDVVARILNSIESHKLPPQFADHTFGPTYIDDFAKIINWVIENQATGLFNASSGESWSDFKFASLIVKLIKSDYKVEPGSLAEYLKTSNRPYQKNTALNIDKLKSRIDFKLTPIENALAKRLG